jgi:hypothetical protein
MRIIIELLLAFMVGMLAFVMCKLIFNIICNKKKYVQKRGRRIR